MVGRSLALAISLSHTGCAGLLPPPMPPTTQTLDPGTCGHHEPVPAAGVATFWSGETPPEYDERVAVLRASGHTQHSTGDLVTALRNKAGACGANALIGLQPGHETDSHQPLFGGGTNVHDREQLTGIAVRTPE